MLNVCRKMLFPPSFSKSDISLSSAILNRPKRLDLLSRQWQVDIHG